MKLNEIKEFVKDDSMSNDEWKNKAKEYILDLIDLTNNLSNENESLKSDLDTYEEAYKEFLKNIQK